MMHSPRFDRALQLAATLHDGQRRKGTQIPYLVHPVAVAWTVARYGWDEDTTIAALLHDTIEDCGMTAARLTAELGPRVALLVEWCTEPEHETKPWEERKAEAVARMRTMPPEARAIVTADKAHNLHTIADLLEGGDPDPWSRFKRGAPEQMRYYTSALTALGQGFEHPILDELRRAIGRVRRFVG